MKIKLSSATGEVCTLQSIADPPGVSARATMNKILEYFRDGEWIWINGDNCAVRYDSITKVEIVAEPSVHELSEETS